MEQKPDGQNFHSIVRDRRTHYQLGSLLHGMCDSQWPQV